MQDKFLEKLLDAYQLSYEDYLEMTKEVSYEDLENPYDFLNIDKAKDRILQAIENQEKIMIYGDYDCDGFSSVSILVNMFWLTRRRMLSTISFIVGFLATIFNSNNLYIRLAVVM